VDLAVARAVESDGEGEQVGNGFGGERAQRGRVDPAGQERADRDVAAQVRGHRVAQRGQDLVRRARRRGPGRPQLGAPVPEHVDLPARPGDQHVPGRPPPGGAISTCPGVSARAGGTRVAGAGTYWNDRYRRSASGSRAVASPGPASALRSEANLSWGPDLGRWPPVVSA